MGEIPGSPQDVMLDVYMTPSQRRAYEDILRQLAEARAECERLWEHKVALLNRAEAAESQLAAQRERDGRDAERYRRLAKHAFKNEAYDRYGPGAHWSIGLYAADSSMTFDAAVDALKDRP
jgi:hypothetical protein